MQDLFAKLEKRGHSEDKTRRLEYARTVSLRWYPTIFRAHKFILFIKNRFPSQDYVLKFKPKYTKPLDNQSTANCTICSVTKENLKLLVKSAKTFCNCGSHECENWWCICEDEEEDCSCGPCQCQECSDCRVRININLHIIYSISTHYLNNISITLHHTFYRVFYAYTNFCSHKHIISTYWFISTLSTLSTHLHACVKHPTIHNYQKCKQNKIFFR